MVTQLYHKAQVLVGMLEEKESSLTQWQRKGIYDYLEEAQRLIDTPDRRKSAQFERRANGHQ